MNDIDTLDAARKVVEDCDTIEHVRSVMRFVDWDEKKLLRKAMRERWSQEIPKARKSVLELEGYTDQGTHGKMMCVVGVGADRDRVVVVDLAPVMPVGYGPNEWVGGMWGKFKITVEFEPEKE